MAMLIGNLLGHSIGLGGNAEVAKEKEWNWFGLAHYWHPEEEELSKSWWAVWE